MSWGVRLEGHEFDLLNWSETLRRPFDPWVEKVERAEWNEAYYVFRSAGFDGAKTPQEVKEAAGPMIDRLTGAMSLVRGGERLQHGAIIEFDNDGSIRRHYVIACGSASARSRASAVGVALTSAGVPAPAPPQQKSDPQRWNHAAEGMPAERADLIADLLVHVGRCDNWFDIYKTIELAEKLMGGAHELQKFAGVEGDALKTARTTANFYRHARAHRPAVPTPIGEARRLAHLLARMVLDREVPLPKH